MFMCIAVVTIENLMTNSYFLFIKFYKILSSDIWALPAEDRGATPTWISYIVLIKQKDAY